MAGLIQNMDHENRVVVLIDMDCFYCQVEEKLNPELKGKPIAVVQYNPWKGGGIIAVNYVARGMGVTRHMRADEAKEKCPEIQLPSVPCQRGKADITKYRDAGKEVAKVLQRFTALLERASIDEAYLDITIPVNKRLESLKLNTLTSAMMPNSFTLGYESIESFISEVHSFSSESIEFDYDHATQLLVGALIVSEIRAAVYEETGYSCSAGIAHNKILAKLVCGMNKPNKQTVLPKHSINILYKTLPLKKVKHLGGKFGDNVCDVLKIKTMAELQSFKEKELQSRFDEKNGSWLYNIARGIDLEPVQARFNPKSIGCCKQFKGKAALLDLYSLKKWLKDLGDEIEDRLEKDALENNRTPKQVVVSFSLQLPDGRDTSSSRSYNFTAEDEVCGELFTSKALELLLESAEGCKPKDDENNRRLKAPIKFLGISVGKFEDNIENKKTKKIIDYFVAGSSKEIVPTLKENTNIKDKCNNNNNEGKEYIIRKFFNNFKNSEKNITREEHKENINENTKVLEASLDKQESFFAKYLNVCPNTNVSNMKQVSQNCAIESKIKVGRSNTPDCNVIPCGDNSNDTDYSGSTINEEINKSIALFEEDPDEIVRVSNMRQLLNKSKEPELEHEITDKSVKEQNKPKAITPVSNLNYHMIESVNCSECGKTISLDKFEEHSDYHVALKLREEERLQVRKDREKISVKEVNSKDQKKKKAVTVEVSNKNETMSIANFLTKIDDRTPVKICAECGKKVLVEKFLEHQDFHEAQKLNKELNNKQTLSNLTSNSVKRKKKSESPIKKAKMQCKPIDLFFSSSNIISNLLHEQSYRAHSQLFDENECRINNILHSIKENNNHNIQSWKSSLSKMPDPLAIFERSLPQCTQCEIKKKTSFLVNDCICKPQLKSMQSVFLQSSQSSSQESKEEVIMPIKPKFGNTRTKKTMPNKFVPIANREHSRNKDLINKDDNLEIAKPTSVDMTTDVEMVDEEKAHKSQVAKITFKTAKEQLLASNPAARRTLGASRRAQAKFVSPMLGAMDKLETSEPVVTDERLKHIDPKMIELIESEIIDKGTPIGWDDIAGLQLAKSVIQEAVVWPLLRPDIFTGLRRPPRGILLFGPPGTGKTLIGKCVSAQCNATFFSISASSLTSKWIGDGEKMVRALFAVARCHQPAVIFIDEIDSLLTQRSDGEHEATRRIKTEFLVQFDGAATGDEDRLLIVGATNRPQELDEAARRRLVKRLYIPLPDADARKQIISNLLKNVTHDLCGQDIMEIAALTEGYSGADMKSLCSEAAMGPIRSVPLSQIVTIDRDKVRPVNVQDFKAALQRVRPSVSQDDLGQYVKWNNTYGQGF